MIAKQHLLIAVTLCAMPALASEPLESLCQQKAEEIQRQLEIAEQAQNRGQVAGLTRALQGVQHNCSNEQLLNDAAREVREHTAEVREREAVTQKMYASAPPNWKKPSRNSKPAARRCRHWKQHNEVIRQQPGSTGRAHPPASHHL